MKIWSGTLPVDSVMIPALAASPTLIPPRPFIQPRCDRAAHISSAVSNLTAEPTDILQHKQGVRNVINSRARTRPIWATGSGGLARIHGRHPGVWLASTGWFML